MEVDGLAVALDGDSGKEVPARVVDVVLDDSYPACIGPRGRFSECVLELLDLGRREHHVTCKSFSCEDIQYKLFYTGGDGESLFQALFFLAETLLEL